MIYLTGNKPQLLNQLGPYGIGLLPHPRVHFSYTPPSISTPEFLDMSSRHLKQYEEFKSLTRCNCLLLALMPDMQPPYECLIEMGMMLSIGKPVYISAPNVDYQRILGEWVMHPNLIIFSGGPEAFMRAFQCALSNQGKGADGFFQPIHRTESPG